MEVNERDPVTGRETTGHEWNGIKELDTPVPRGVLMFLIATHIWAIAWWFFVPAWPLGTTYTKGLLGVDQRTTVEERVVEGQHASSSAESCCGKFCSAVACVASPELASTKYVRQNTLGISSQAPQGIGPSGLKRPPRTIGMT